MTAVLNFTAVATAIHGLSIPGIQIMDLGNVAPSYKVTGPILTPRPDGYISNFRLGDRTFGTAGSELWTVMYDLTYRYMHCPIGQRLDFGILSALITNLAAISAAIMNNDTLNGAADVTLGTISRIGPVTDPAGNQYHGCDFVIHITQYT